MIKLPLTTLFTTTDFDDLVIQGLVPLIAIRARGKLRFVRGAFLDKPLVAIGTQDIP